MNKYHPSVSVDWIWKGIDAELERQVFGSESLLLRTVMPNIEILTILARTISIISFPAVLDHNTDEAQSLIWGS